MTKWSVLIEQYNENNNVDETLGKIHRGELNFIRIQLPYFTGISFYYDQHLETLIYRIPLSTRIKRQISTLL